MVGPATSPLENIAQSERRWRGYLEGVRARDVKSLARLYDETSSILYGLAFRILGDPRDAEEIVVDVYRQIWHSTDAFESGIGTVLSSLILLTRRSALDRIQSEAAGPPAPVASTREDFPVRAIDCPADRYRDERELVQRALAGLAPEQREAVELVFFRGLMDTEVSQTLGVPVGTIRERIRAGMGKLRERLRRVAAVERKADGRQKTYRAN